MNAEAINCSATWIQVGEVERGQGWGEFLQSLTNNNSLRAWCLANISQSKQLLSSWMALSAAWTGLREKQWAIRMEENRRKMNKEISNKRMKRIKNGQRLQVPLVRRWKAHVLWVWWPESPATSISGSALVIIQVFSVYLCA